MKQKDLAEAGDAAFDLYRRLREDGDHARESSGSAAVDLKGDFEIGGALDHVNTGWREQLRSLTDACAHISDHPEYTHGAHADDEIQDVLVKATESDSTAAGALKALADQSPHGFSDASYSDRDAAGALKAADRATELAPEGVLNFWAGINDPHPNVELGQARVKQYGDLQKHLGPTLATATRSDSSRTQQAEEHRLRDHRHRHRCGVTLRRDARRRGRQHGQQRRPGADLR